MGLEGLRQPDSSMQVSLSGRILGVERPHRRMGLTIVTYLFVYGTLMKDCCNHKAYLAEQRYVGQAVIEGYALYDLGYYPGIIPARGGMVRGELYKVDRDTLVAVDTLEGSGYLYDRVTVNAKSIDGRVFRAHTYVWKGQVSDTDKIEFDDQPWSER